MPIRSAPLQTQKTIEACIASAEGWSSTAESRSLVPPLFGLAALAVFRRRRRDR